jgi:hypothetical protein
MFVLLAGCHNSYTLTHTQRERERERERYLPSSFSDTLSPSWKEHLMSKAAEQKREPESAPVSTIIRSSQLTGFPDQPQVSSSIDYCIRQSVNPVFTRCDRVAPGRPREAELSSPASQWGRITHP